MLNLDTTSLVLVSTVIFIFGTAFGSFVLVLIDRLPKNQPVLIGRSACDSCKRPLDWFTMIPVLSFLYFRGKTNCCGAKLKMRYPLSEIAMGVFLLLFVLLHPSIVTGLALFQILFVVLLIAVFFIDLKHMIIPDEIIKWSIVLYVVQLAFLIFTDISDTVNVLYETSINHVVPAFLAAGFFYMLVVLTKGRGMGGGDVKLAFVMGLFLLPLQLLVSLYLAFLIGAVVAVGLLIVGKKRFGQVVPFGPFMVIGTIIAMLFSTYIVEAYMQLVSF